MHMTFEQIPPPEHPAVYAAKTIKQMHVDTIAGIDGGFKYHKKLENGESVDCSDEMRAACLHQIELCDAIIDTSRELPAELLAPVTLLLEDARVTIEQKLKEVADAESTLPEIGNYDHKET